MYADSMINEDAEDDDLIDPDVDSNRPLIDYSFDQTDNISISNNNTIGGIVI